MPPVTLPAEHAEALGRLGPGDRVGHEGDTMGSARIVPVAPEPQDDLHVLAHGVVNVTTDVDDAGAAEEAERAGDDQVTAEAVPAHPPEEEGAEVLHHLHPRQRRTGNPRRHHPPAINQRPVGDPDRSARRHHG